MVATTSKQRTLLLVVHGRHDGAHLLGHAQCFDDDDDDLTEETLGDNLAGDGDGVTSNKGVLKDFLLMVNS